MTREFDLVVIGAGPAGQKAAIQGTKAGRSVLMVDRAKSAGGACVRFGTIPSKTLRETALALRKFKKLTANLLDLNMPEQLQLDSLMTRKDQVILAHEHYWQAQLARNGVELWQGMAEFVSPQALEVRAVDGSRRRAEARWFVIATGSHPRTPGNVPVDHEHILDSDSLLSLSYLPASLIVLGSGVIACEYASIFAALGVKVTVIDKSPEPLSFLDPELTRSFVTELETVGGSYLGQAELERVGWDGLSSVDVELRDGRKLSAEKLFCALGRLASVKGLGLEAAGVGLNERGFIQVDANCRTRTPHIYAAGDVIGPPALASTAMEQGRRAVCHALGIALGDGRELAPVGIYTIPEIGSVGLSEAQALAKHPRVRVGRAPFGELARGQISAADAGLLKLVCDAETGRVLGAHAVGETASELIHLGQLAILSGNRYDAFIDTVFNFPTFAEAYRVAALDILGQERAERSRATS